MRERDTRVPIQEGCLVSARVLRGYATGLTPGGVSRAREVGHERRAGLVEGLRENFDARVKNGRLSRWTGDDEICASHLRAAHEDCGVLS